MMRDHPLGLYSLWVIEMTIKEEVLGVQGQQSLATAVVYVSQLSISSLLASATLTIFFEAFQPGLYALEEWSGHFGVAFTLASSVLSSLCREADN